jgi:hypothetical protein
VLLDAEVDEVEKVVVANVGEAIEPGEVEKGADTIKASGLLDFRPLRLIRGLLEADHGGFVLRRC